MAAMSDAQLLTLFNEALQAVARGQAYQIGTRSLTRADLPEIIKTIEWLERRIDVATDTTGGTVLGVFRDAE